MINYIHGDLLTTPDKYIAHGVNCKAVMGAGVAKAIRAKYPKVHTDYLSCFEGIRLLGYKPDALPEKLLGHVNDSLQPDGVVVFNCFTQLNYGTITKYVSYDAVDKCMAVISCLMPPDCPISMPKIGSGLAGGHWPVIEEIVEYRLQGRLINVYYKD